MNVEYFEWRGTNDDFDDLQKMVGADHIKTVASIDWRTDKVRVFDDRKQNWVLVRPGDYVLKEGTEVIVRGG